MNRHTRAPMILLVAVAVGLLASMGYVVISGYGRESAYDMLAAQQAAADAAEPDDDQNTELLARVDGTATVQSSLFSVDLPQGWLVHGSDSVVRLADGTLLYGWLYNTDASQAPDSEVVSVSIKDVLKGERSFEEVAASLAWDDSDVKEIVAFMSEEADDIFPDYSEADVRVSTGVDSIGGLPAERNMLQCLKPCYVEGAAQTNVIYFIDGGDRVYLLGVSTNTRSTTADFLNEADAAVRTFRLR